MLSREDVTSRYKSVCLTQRERKVPFIKIMKFLEQEMGGETNCEVSPKYGTISE